MHFFLFALGLSALRMINAEPVAEAASQHTPACYSHPHHKQFSQGEWALYCDRNITDSVLEDTMTDVPTFSKCYNACESQGHVAATWDKKTEICNCWGFSGSPGPFQKGLYYGANQDT